MHKILIVEDDKTMRDALVRQLSKWDYEVRCVVDFKQILSDFASFSPQLVLLDISLPFMNGYHWCAEIRKHSSVPIVFISSASDNLNIVMAINMGADDFIAKPFDLNVLCAKLGAILRRAYSFTGQSNLLSRGEIVLNLNDTTLTYNENKLELTKNDFRLLQLLFENAGKVVSRDAIMTHLWESESFIDDNTLTVNITRLRKKLEEIGIENFIKTKKGIGYMVE